MLVNTSLLLFASVDAGLVPAPRILTLHLIRLPVIRVKAALEVQSVVVAGIGEVQWSARPHQHVVFIKIALVRAVGALIDDVHQAVDLVRLRLHVLIAVAIVWQRWQRPVLVVMIKKLDELIVGKLIRFLVRTRLTTSEL